MVVHLIFGPAAPARRQYRAPLEGFRLSSPRPFSRHHRSDVVILCASDRFSTSDRFSRGASASNAFPTCLNFRSVSKDPSARRLLVAADMPSAERTGRIAGRYTTQLKGCAYTYEATWREAGDGVIWSATLKRDDQLIGTPTGQIRAAGGVNLNDEVRRLVESAIEARANKK